MGDLMARTAHIGDAVIIRQSDHHPVGGSNQLQGPIGDSLHQAHRVDRLAHRRGQIGAVQHPR
jgi:hypothetical protein